MTQGWVCPKCGSAVAPTVTEHCVETKTQAPGTNPVYPYPTMSYCIVCGGYYAGAHFCTGKVTITNPQPPYITWGNEGNTWTNIPPNQPVNPDDDDPDDGDPLPF